MLIGVYVKIKRHFKYDKSDFELEKIVKIGTAKDTIMLL